jgi:hypothetical protein
MGRFWRIAFRRIAAREGALSEAGGRAYFDETSLELLEASFCIFFIAPRGSPFSSPPGPDPPDGAKPC